MSKPTDEEMETTLYWTGAVSDPAPERPFLCVNYDGQSIYETKEADEHFTLLETKLAEAISQRDSARTDLGAIALALGMHEEASRTTIVQGAMECMESWAKDIQAKEDSEAEKVAVIAQRDRLQDVLVEEQGKTCRLGFELRKAEAALATEVEINADLRANLSATIADAKLWRDTVTAERARVLQEAAKSEEVQ